MEENAVLTTGEAANYCGVNFRTVIRWIEKGRLKAYQLPGRGDNRIQVKDFIRFLQDNHMPVPAELSPSSQKILIVDDDRHMAAAIERTLSRGGFEAQVSHDGFQAGAALAQEKPAVMTLDLSMPGCNGFDVIAYVRSTEAFKAVKILVVSALGKEEMQRARMLGADATLTKPFDNSELLATVEGLLRP